MEKVIKLSEEAHKKLKVKAAQEGKSLKELLNNLAEVSNQ